METKIWGTTHCLFQNDQVSIHDLWIEKGGYCSRHKHKSKFNTFYIISGTLVVRIWRFETSGKDICDEHILIPGDSLVVPPGDLHQFEARDYTRALEIYHTELDEFDIERDTQGGIRH